MVRTSLIIFLLFSLACSSEESLTKNELISYLEDVDHGLIQFQNQGNLKCTLRYRPSNLMAFNDMVTSTNTDSILNHYNQYIYLLISYDINKGGINTRADLASKQHIDDYLTKDFISKVSLRSGKSELRLLDHISVNMFGYTSSSEIMLVFERSEADDNDLKFVIEEGPLSFERWNFEIRSKDIRSVPELKLES